MTTNIEQIAIKFFQKNNIENVVFEKKGKDLFIKNGDKIEYCFENGYEQLPLYMFDIKNLTENLKGMLLKRESKACCVCYEEDIQTLKCPKCVEGICKECVIRMHPLFDIICNTELDREALVKVCDEIIQDPYNCPNCREEVCIKINKK